MKRGFFAHCICYRQQIYRKHILFIDEKEQIVEIIPFCNETSNTVFVDGILITVSSVFHKYLKEFTATLNQQLENSETRLSEAITTNPVYRNHIISEGHERCSLFCIPEVDWENDRPKALPIEIDTVFPQ